MPFSGQRPARCLRHKPRALQKANALDQRLKDCARQAEQQVNFPLFGDREPTREECGEELEVDGCEKHDIALACAREVLQQFWPAPFSIEQRYRYFRHVQFLETISRAEEQRLIEQGCTRELWRTLKPDVILHSNHNLLRAVLIIDFKFPCPPSNAPTWKHYGKASAYDGLNQGQVYKEALDGETLLLTPRGIF